jgi:hypothetical protein
MAEYDPSCRFPRDSGELPLDAGNPGVGYVAI